MPRTPKVQEKLKELEKRIRELEAEKQELRKQVAELQYSPHSFKIELDPDDMNETVVNENAVSEVHEES